jgi:hypothetical protein
LDWGASAPLFIFICEVEMTYGEFAGHVFGLLETLGVLEPLKFFLLFVLAVAGMSAFIKFLSGRVG